MQGKYSDEFTDLMDIITRYTRLSMTNNDLRKNHQDSGGEMDNLIGQIDGFKKDAGQKTLTYTNLIADEQRQLQEIEAVKANLMIGNEEETEHRLKQTNEHGVILMSIKCLYKKIAPEKSADFIWGKTLGPSRSDETHGQVPVYDSKECLEQLEVIEHYIKTFEKFTGYLKEPKVAR